MRSTNILILLVALNVSATLIGVSGLGQEIGYQPTVGGDEQIDQANETATNVETNRGGLDSFIGAVISAGSALVTIFSVVIAGPRMIMNLGVPPIIVGAVATPLYILVGIDILEVISGRRLT